MKRLNKKLERFCKKKHVHYTRFDNPHDKTTNRFYKQADYEMKSTDW